MSSAAAPGPVPFVSVVIPTHGRPEAVITCLRSLQRQTMDRSHFEIVIADDASPVPVENALRASAPDLAGFCKIIRHERSHGPGAARNAGVAAGRGKLIAFTDDDCLPAPNWLDQLWTSHLEHPHALLGGQLYNAVPELLGAEASQVISDIVYAWYNVDPLNARFFSTNNAAVPREMFVQLGGFNEAFRGASEDRDFCDRWRFAGNRMVMVPEARVGHAHRLTVSKFIRQHFGYGRGAATFHTERSSRGSGRIQDEMPFHRALPRLARARLQQESLSKQFALAGMIALWQIANAGGYAWERWSPKG